MKQKTVIYQLIPRLFSNRTENCEPGGTIERNGSGKLNDITLPVLKSLKSLGINHMWYTGVIEHAHCTDYSQFGIAPDNKHVVKGLAGSPYAISDYYDIDPDVAENVPERMKEFEALVERTHEAGMKVVLDFIPNHVARRYHSDAAPEGVADLGEGDDVNMFFSPANNFYYLTGQEFSPTIDLGTGDERYVEFPAKASGNDCFTASPGVNDWYETVKLNYGVDPWNGARHFDPIPPTWHKMLDILHFWAGKGVDSFRCDMAHMVPMEFWHWAIGDMKKHYPAITFIAEIYDMGLYRPFIEYCGFDYLYDKVNLYDTLRAVTCGAPASEITGCWQRVDGLGAHMLNFLENHDEQRIASRFFAGNAFAGIPALAVSSMISTGPMMIYAGQELGEKAEGATGFSGDDGRTTIFDYYTIPTLRRWMGKSSTPSVRGLSEDEKRLRGLYSDILNIAAKEPAVVQGGFFDLMYVNYDSPGFNPNSHYAFLRHDGGDTLLVAVNFSGEEARMKIKIPALAFECMGIRDGEAKVTELMSGSSGVMTFVPDGYVDVALPPYGVAVYKRTDPQMDVDKKSRSTRSRNSKK